MQGTRALISLLKEAIMLETVIGVLLGIGAFAIASIVSGAWLIAERIIHPPRENYEDIETDLKNRLQYTDAEFDALKAIPHEPVELHSNYVYFLKGRLFDQGAKKSIVLLHREGRNLMASYKFLQMYRDLGYNILMCDARYHGSSGGDNYTYGYFERWDLKTQADYLFSRYGNDSLLGFHGESGGAATALMTLYHDKRIGFAIADSSFSELLEVMLDLEERLIDYSVRIIRLSEELPDSKAGRHISAQLLRSGTSPAPNYGEAQSAESRADFIHKIKIALKELKESRIWLKVIARAEMLKSSSSLESLLQETEELIAILFTSAQTARKHNKE